MNADLLCSQVIGSKSPFLVDGKSCVLSMCHSRMLRALKGHTISSGVSREAEMAVCEWAGPLE